MRRPRRSVRPEGGSRTIGPRRLWFEVLAGPIGWVVALLVADIIVEYSCATGLAAGTILGLPVVRGPVFLITLAAAAVTAAAGVAAYHDWQALRARAAIARGARQSRAEFMALAGVLLNAIFLIALVFQGITVYFLPPCPGA